MKKMLSIILIVMLLLSLTSYAVAADRDAFVNNQESITEGSDYVRYNLERITQDIYNLFVSYRPTS